MTEKKEVKISFSEYRLFKSCPFKHFLQRTLNMQEPPSEILIFGSALHNSIEELVKHKRSSLFHTAVFKKNLLKESKGFLTEEQINFFCFQGVKLLDVLNFFKRYSDYEIVAVEHEFWQPILEEEEYICFFKGFADLILRNKKTKRYLIIDWKSSMKPWDIEKKQEDRGFFGQLALYRYFFSKELGISKDLIDCQFVTLSRFGETPIEVFNINISQNFEDEIMDDMKDVIKKINQPFEYREKAKFNNGMDGCKWCTFSPSICNDKEKQIITTNET